MSKPSIAMAAAQLAMVLAAGAQVPAQESEVRPRMLDVLQYVGVESPAPADVTRMAELWTKAQQGGMSAEERRLAFRDLYLLYGKLKGRDLTATPQALDGLAQFVTMIYQGGGRMELKLPEPRGRAVGNYLHVETRGNGPIPLLLISDAGVDGRNLYGSFAQRQAAAYT